MIGTGLATDVPDVMFAFAVKEFFESFLTVFSERCSLSKVAGFARAAISFPPVVGGPLQLSILRSPRQQQSHVLVCFILFS